MTINIGYLTANKTSAGDEVYTPFYAVEPLMEFCRKTRKYGVRSMKNGVRFISILRNRGLTWNEAA